MSINSKHLFTCSLSSRREKGAFCSGFGTFLSFVCRIVQAQCCAAAVRDQLCDKGITMAKRQGACERPFFSGQVWETKISKVLPNVNIFDLYTSPCSHNTLYKSIHSGNCFPDSIEIRFLLYDCFPAPPPLSPVQMCCDCCMLGLITVSRASSCELQGLFMERQCTHTAKTCCGINSAEDPKQTGNRS